MTHASVFSGIGGPEVAATMLGWENLFHCEINPFGRKVLDYWYPNAKSYEDITKTDFREWRGRVNVLTGGFPCQPFSYAGQRRGAEDDRYLWPHMYRCIDEIRPDWVVAENVAGILTMVEQGTVSKVASSPTLFDTGDMVRGQFRLTETFTLERICTDLESHGYAVQPILIPACAVGAPHRRDRVFIVARRIASDTDNSADRRATRKDEGESREERIQERHEIRKPDEPNQIRREGENDATTDTACRGEGTPRKSGEPESSGSDTHQQPSEWRETTEWNSRFYELLRPTPNTKSECSQRMRLEQPEDSLSRSRVFGGANIEDGSRRDAADTSCERLERSRGMRIQGNSGGSTTAANDEPPRADAETTSGDEEQIWWDAAYSYIDRMERYFWPRISEKPQSGFSAQELADRYGHFWPSQRWQDFPIVSPVHRGNDGIPFDVDCLTISFGKWRTEALKAYGNAIVPQVMYEIFRAIEEVEQSFKLT